MLVTEKRQSSGKDNPNFCKAQITCSSAAHPCHGKTEHALGTMIEHGSAIIMLLMSGEDSPEHFDAGVLALGIARAISDATTSQVSVAKSYLLLFTYIIVTQPL